MGEAVVLDIGREALYTVILVIMPVLGAGLITGLLVAIFQATTQIQEQTLAFVPKIFAVLAAIGFFGPWIMTTVVEFVQELLRNIPLYLGG
ncbi:flagellar biosynthetic protein FliQ [Halanaerobium congolense]|uniref:Flagellar biosynthetic protein FliQ n=1 Tax=Halanaerobium congolense TaxID=54121 RepID=A0A1I0B0S3_9FIRM|nr:flagellar biosynthesis protein FliQ [Halanaerobium congolense]PTX16526.1 flagellar biosynthetic protein FliQ [Halanaerobium congolense]SDF58881.1 flagellar biosynthetic protein FliQ [Halanaerobium congolense]SET00273.1 flagellar biosynthetic protein FliQ [Halanaerobium congolense]SFP36628.1 flagellar biosynthetic protein FliQ [Halanaerobium congolense]